MEIATAFLLTVNETLTTGNALIAVSLLLFNLTRNFSNRVAKTSAVALACVTIVYHEIHSRRRSPNRHWGTHP